MGYKWWDKEQLNYLKKHYASSYTEDLAKQLDRKIHQVQRKAHDLGLFKDTYFMCKRTPMVEQLDYYTGEHIGYYDSIQDASIDNDCRHATINYAIRNNEGRLPLKELRFRLKERKSSCEKEPFRPKI